MHLIAEPWDAAPDGYQVGRFPGRFLEWNDKFRDTVRRYWLLGGTPQAVGRGELARRFTASSDLFNHGQRTPLASVNFIAVHDGYTLADLTSYDAQAQRGQRRGQPRRPRRRAERELRRRGADRRPRASSRTRGRVRRAMMATLLLAQGTPMLCAGDEIGNSQQGNNNAYCHDGPLDVAGLGRRPTPRSSASSPTCSRCAARTPRCARATGAPPPRWAPARRA